VIVSHILNVSHHPSGELAILPGRFVLFKRLVGLFLLRRFTRFLSSFRRFGRVSAGVVAIRLAHHRHRVVRSSSSSSSSQSNPDLKSVGNKKNAHESTPKLSKKKENALSLSHSERDRTLSLSLSFKIVYSFVSFVSFVANRRRCNKHTADLREKR
jgi:hypothetical protein